MNEAQFLQRHTIFSTREFAFLCDRSRASASRRLGMLVEHQAVTKLTKGIWCQKEHPRFTPNAAINHLLGNERGYISFLSALHLRGAISQIPPTIQVATTGHGRVLPTPVGTYEFIRIKPERMASGIDASSTSPSYAIATAEKALLDVLYINARKGRRFSRLPELDTSVFDNKRLRLLFEAQGYPKPIDSGVRQRLEAVLDRKFR